MEQDIYFFGQTAYVTYRFLINRGIPQSTIYNNTSHSGEKKRWFTKSLSENKKIKLVAYDSLPASLVVKYNLPNYYELKEIADLHLEQIRSKLKTSISKHVKIILDLEYYSWEELKGDFGNKFLSEEKLEMFCKNYALLKKVMELYELGYKLKSLFSAYYQYDNLVFQTESYKSFYNKILQIKNGKPIEDVLIHGLLNRPSNNLKKDEDVIIEIKRLYSDGKKLNAASILNYVNDYLVRSNRSPISISSVYNVISQIEVKNETMLLRHGKRYTEDHLFPHQRFESPEAPGILWGVDGSRFQFYYKTRHSKYKTLIYFIVMETYDRTIIGYSYDETENKEMVKKAFEMACSKTQYLPREIISDNSKVFDSWEFKKIRALFKDWKGNWQQTNSNPRSNGYAERYFGVFQESYCKEIDGYIGDGLKSRNVNGKPSPEEIKKFLSSKKLYTREELISHLDQLIKDYNKTNEKVYSQDKNHKNKISPIPLNVTKYSQLFWEEKEHIISKDAISFDLNNKTYRYLITEEEISRKYNGTIVLVRYNRNDLNKIVLFDPKNDEYIITLEKERKIPRAKIERTEPDNIYFIDISKRIQNLKIETKKRAENIIELSNANREKLPPKLIEFGVGSKQEIEEAEGKFVSDEFEELVKTEHDNLASNVNFDSLFRNLYSKI